MAYRDRSLTEDIKKNIIDVGLKGDITEGDKRRYAKIETKPDPFITYPKKPKEPDLENLNDFQIAFLNAYEKATAKRKLPSKYTKKGLIEVGKLLSGNIFMQHKALSDYKKERESGEREYIEGYTDIAT